MHYERRTTKKNVRAPRGIFNSTSNTLLRLVFFHCSVGCVVSLLPRMVVMITKWDALAGTLPRLDVRHIAGELLREFLRRTLCLAKKDCDWIWYTADSSMDIQPLVAVIFTTSASVSDLVSDHVSGHRRKQLHNKRDVYIHTELGRVHLP